MQVPGCSGRVYTKPGGLGRVSVIYKYSSRPTISGSPTISDRVGKSSRRDRIEIILRYRSQLFIIFNIHI